MITWREQIISQVTWINLEIFREWVRLTLTVIPSQIHTKQSIQNTASKTGGNFQNHQLQNKLITFKCFRRLAQLLNLIFTQLGLAFDSLSRLKMCRTDQFRICRSDYRCIWQLTSFCLNRRWRNRSYAVNSGRERSSTAIWNEVWCFELFKCGDLVQRGGCTGRVSVSVGRWVCRSGWRERFELIRPEVAIK